MTWMGKHAPGAVTILQIERGATTDKLLWYGARDYSGADYLLYNIYASEQWPVDVSDARNLVIARCRQQSVTFPNKGRSLHYAVTAHDRYGNESAPVMSAGMGVKRTKPIDFRQLIMGHSLKKYK